MMNHTNAMLKNKAISTIDADENYDHVYFNVTIPGPIWDHSTNSLSNTLAQFQQQFNQPILYNPSEYYLACLRFSIPTALVPLILVEPQGGIDPNKLIYSISLSAGGQTVQQYLEWVPNPVPSSPSDFYYYALNDYSSFADMINKAFSVAFTTLSGLTVLPVGSLAPFVYYNSSLQKFQLSAQVAYYKTLPDGSGAAINVYMNTPLQNLFTGLPYVFNGYSAANGTQFQYLFLDLKNNYYTPSYTAPEYPGVWLQMTQDYPALANWNTMKSIQFISNTLPIRKEYVPSNVDNPAALSASGILKDFIPIYGASDSARTTLDFAGDSGPNQMINMYGNVPISIIDISVVWTDRFGKQYPLYIPYNQSLSLKLGFFRKKTFTS